LLLPRTRGPPPAPPPASPTTWLPCRIRPPGERGQPAGREWSRARARRGLPSPHIVCDFAARELRHGSAARRQASRRPASRSRWHHTGGTTARKCSTPRSSRHSRGAYARGGRCGRAHPPKPRTGGKRATTGRPRRQRRDAGPRVAECLPPVEGRSGAIIPHGKQANECLVRVEVVVDRKDRTPGTHVSFSPLYSNWVAPPARNIRFPRDASSSSRVTMPPGRAKPPPTTSTWRQRVLHVTSSTKNARWNCYERAEIPNARRPEGSRPPASRFQAGRRIRFRATAPPQPSGSDAATP